MDIPESFRSALAVAFVLTSIAAALDLAYGIARDIEARMALRAAIRRSGDLELVKIAATAKTRALSEAEFDDARERIEAVAATLPDAIRLRVNRHTSQNRRNAERRYVLSALD